LEVAFWWKEELCVLFDTGKEERVEIQDSNHLYEFASRIVNVIDRYEKKGVAAG